MSRSSAVLLLLANLLAAAGCKPDRASPPPPSLPAASSAAGPAVAARPTLLPLLRDEALTTAAWSSSGAVVAMSARRFWQFRADGEKIAMTSAFDEGDRANSLVTARAAEVSVVTTEAGKAHVFRGAARVSTFSLGAGQYASALSDDGSILTTFGLNGRRGGVYDTATARHLADLSGRVILSAGAGEYAISEKGVLTSRTGAVLVALPPDMTRTAAWVDGSAIMWGDDELVVVNPRGPTTKKVRASCGEVRDVRDYVDVVAGRALRACGSRLFVIVVDGLVRTEVAIPGGLDTPNLLFAPNAPGIFLDRGRRAKTVLEVDPALRKTRSHAALPSVRQANGDVGRDDNDAATPSPDGTLLLSKRSPGAVVVLDRASGRERTAWGASGRREARSNLAAFLHQGGLEIVAELEPPELRVLARLGPAAAPFKDVPLLTPQRPCHDSPYDPQRVLNGNEAIFFWPYGGSCVCVTGGCADPSLPNGVRARSGEHVIALDDRQRTVSYFEKGIRRGEATLDGYLLAAAFLDGAKTVAALVSALPESVNLLELALPTFDVRRRLVVPDWRGLGAVGLLGTDRSIVVARSSQTELQATVFARAGDAGVPLEVDAWSGGGVARLGGARVELVGAGAENTLACLGADGLVRPFASCRSAHEVHNVFRVE